MRFVALILLLFGCLLIALGRHVIRGARRISRRRAHVAPRRSSPIRRIAGWALTLLGFIAILFAVALW